MASATYWWPWGPTGGPSDLLVALANGQSGIEKGKPLNSIIAAGNPANSQSGSEEGKPQNSIIAAGNPYADCPFAGLAAAIDEF